MATPFEVAIYKKFNIMDRYFLRSKPYKRSARHTFLFMNKEREHLPFKVTVLLTSLLGR